MKKNLLTALLLCALGVQAFASINWVEGSDVRYAGGSTSSIKLDAIGKLELSSPTDLIYVASGAKVAVPYAAITSFYYTEKVAHHLGVLPAIAVGLVKARRQRHILHIAYRDSGGALQTLVLEVSKDAQSAVRTTIEARIPQPTKRLPCGCGVQR